MKKKMREMAEGPAVAKRDPEQKRSKNVKRIDMERSANKGLIITHHFDNSGPGYGYNESEPHTFGKDEDSKALAHIKQHMGMDCK